MYFSETQCSGAPVWLLLLFQRTVKKCQAFFFNEREGRWGAAKTVCLTAATLKTKQFCSTKQTHSSQYVVNVPAIQNEKK